MFIGCPFCHRRVGRALCDAFGSWARDCRSVTLIRVRILQLGSTDFGVPACWSNLCHSYSGIVTRVGSKVTEFKVGDRAGVGAQGEFEITAVGVGLESLYLTTSFSVLVL